MNLALNPFDKGRKPERIDLVNLDSDIADIIKLFDDNAFDSLLSHDKTCNNIRDDITVKTPAEIDIIYQTLEAYLDSINEDRYSCFLSLFVGEFIQKSYFAGYNDFHITPLLSPPILLGYELMAIKKPLRLTVNGDVGDGFGEKSYNCVFKANNAGKNMGSSSIGSRFYVDCVGMSCGSFAKASEFRMKKVGKWCGGAAERCKFFVSSYAHGAGYLWPILDFRGELEVLSANKCRFDTDDKDVFEYLKYNLPRGNKVGLVK